MSLSRKHYFKLADFFGTFEHHLKDTGVWLDNDGEDTRCSILEIASRSTNQENK